MSIVVAGVLVLGWKFVSPSAGFVPVAVKVPQFSTVAARGRMAFGERCAACHGVEGAGTEQGPPLVHDTYNPGHHADEAFYRAVRQGVRQHHWPFGNMEPVPEVPTTEIAKIIRYIRELQEANGIFYKRHVM